MKVLILGGGGVFGSRLATLLARDGHVIVLAARRVEGLRALAADLGCSTMRLDRRGDLTPIVDVAPDVVVDAAGPFQAYGDGPYRLAEFCVANRIHYLDLADDGAFVAGIAALDDAARAAGVFVISGASTVPAISSAAVQMLSRAMTDIRAIDTAILPGNRAPRGQSLVHAILLQAGMPLRLWRGGWVEARGWTERQAYEIAPSVWRHAYLIGAPDLVLFPEYFAARTVTFRAGMELGALNFAVSVFGWLQRRNLIASSEGVVTLSRILSQALAPFGGDKGAMVVSVLGSEGGRLVHRRWRLLAIGGDGPFIPAIPVRALLRKAQALAPGARACLGEVSLGEVAACFQDLKVSTSTEQSVPLFERVLGPAWPALPRTVRDVHAGADAAMFAGHAQVERGRNVIPRFLAGLFGFPEAGTDIPLRVVMRRTRAGETWARAFDRASFRSYLSKRGGADGVVTERFGALSFDIALSVEKGALIYTVLRGRAFGVPMPTFLLPGNETREYEQDGAFHFDVSLSAPMGLGLMVRYRGALAPL